MKKKYKIVNTRNGEEHIVSNLCGIPNKYLEIDGDGNPFLCETDVNCGDAVSGIEMCCASADLESEYYETAGLSSEELYDMAIDYVNSFDNIRVTEVK